MLNSKETVESIKYAVALWKETMDEGGLAWDDTNNNRAFLSQTISATNNGASIYIEAKKQARHLQDREGHADVAGHPARPHPQGAGRPVQLPGLFTDMLMGYSKNQKAAKDFLRWTHSKPVYDQWFISQQGYTCGATKDWEKHAVWDVDPVLKPFQRPAVDRPAGRLCRAARPQGRRGGQQVHHRRHVRQGDPGHAGRGSRQVGALARSPRPTHDLKVTEYRPADGRTEVHSRPIAPV